MLPHAQSGALRDCSGAGLSVFVTYLVPGSDLPFDHCFIFSFDGLFPILLFTGCSVDVPVFKFFSKTMMQDSSKPIIKIVGFPTYPIALVKKQFYDNRTNIKQCSLLEMES